MIRRHVERGVPDFGAGGQLVQFVRAAVFDGDVAAGWCGVVEGAGGGGNVQRYRVRVGGECHAIGADLVGDVTVGGDAIGADDHQIDGAAAQQRGGGAVGEDRDFDAGALQLPRRQAGALSKRAGFIGVYMHLPACGVCGVNRGERSADAGGGKGARVAVGQDAGTIGNQGEAEASDRVAHRHVFAANRLSLLAQRITQHRIGRVRGAANHACHGPREIDGRGAGRDQTRGMGRQVCTYERGVAVADLLERRGQSDGGAHANGRRSPDRERPDRVNDLVQCARVAHELARRQGALVEVSQRPAIGRPRDGGDGKHVVNLARFPPLRRLGCLNTWLPERPPLPRSSMAYQFLTFAVADRIATITVNRPDKLNALNDATIAELGVAIDEAVAREDVRGVLLTGAGRAFVAGADISELQSQTPLEATRRARAGQVIFRQFETSPKPVVAAINGFALGGGCELAMACHVRIASESAKFGQPEVKLGIVPGYGGTQRLPRLVGRGAALRLLLTGEIIGAAEAFRLGLVEAVVAPDVLIETATALLRAMVANAPLALAGCIEVLNRGADVSIEEGCQIESDAFGLLSSTADMREGMTAFLEKRTPAFTGH